MSWTWIITSLGIVGMVLNIRKNKWCFAVWGCTNLCWIIVDIYAGVYSQAFLQGVFLVASIWGIIAWRRK